VRGTGRIMKGFIVIILLTVAACSGEDPCDRCYDADYYYDHPYYCQECLQEKENSSE